MVILTDALITIDHAVNGGGIIILTGGIITKKLSTKRKLPSPFRTTIKMRQALSLSHNNYINLIIQLFTVSK